MRRGTEHAFLVFALIVLLGALSSLGAQETLLSGQQSQTSLPTSSQPGFSVLSAGTASPKTSSDKNIPVMKQDTNASGLSLLLQIATWDDLVRMARREGLSEAGTAFEIRNRLYTHFGLVPPPAVRRPAIILEKAGNASLFKLEGSDGPIVRATGGVLLTYNEPGGAVHRIEAGTIVYDRDANAVSASSGVRYERTENAGSQIFSGSTIVVDLDDWSAVFLNGRFITPASKPALSASGTTSAAGILSALSAGTSGLTITADRILRRQADVVIVEGARITSCDLENPHYLIKAKRAWILGSGDWAVSGATLSVGGVPILWLPFFYNPSEEIIFHPVIGLRSREGRYIQTTTWLLGQKPRASTAGSFLSLGSEKSVQQEVAGIFFRTSPKPALPDPGTGPIAGLPDAGTAGKTSPGGKVGVAGPISTLKLLVDVYSRLGIYAGIEGTIPGDKNASLTFSAGIGVSRSLFYTNTGGWTPFVTENGWKSVWNTSDLGFGVLPFRFGLEMKATTPIVFGKSGLSLSFQFPAFSDPFFEQDFRGRKDDMEWLKLLSDTVTDSEKPAKRTLLAQKIELGGQVGQWKSGLVSALDLTRLTSTMTWYTKTVPASTSSFISSVDPQREFFYPDTLRFFDAGLVVRGGFSSASSSSSINADALTARSSGIQISTDPSANTTPPLPEYRLPIPANEISDGSRTATIPDSATDSGDMEDESPQVRTSDAYFSAVPVPDSAESEKIVDSTLSAEFSSSGRIKNHESGIGFSFFKLPSLAGSIRPAAANAVPKPSVSFNWSFTPTTFYEHRFLPDSWVNVSSIDYRLYYRLLSARVTGTGEARATLFGNRLSTNLSFSILGQDQVRWIENDTRPDPSILHPLKLSDYQYRTARLSGLLGLTVSPFASSWLWSATTFSYSLGSELFSYRYTGLQGNGNDAIPLYERRFASWNASSISVHSATATLGFRPVGLTQKISITATLPPREETYTARLDMDGGSLKAYVQAQAFKDPSILKLALKPILLGFSVGQGTSPKVSGTFAWDLENGLPESLTTSFLWSIFSGSFSARNSSGYKITTARTWEIDGIRKFRPESIQAGLTYAYTAPKTSARPVSINASAALVQSLLKFSESRLVLSLGSTVNLGENFAFTLAGVTQNSSVWRYYASLFPSSGGFNPYEYQINPLVDLGESLAIWDTEALSRSLLKLTSLSFTAKQSLHDWDLSASVIAKPLLVEKTGVRPYYSLDVSVSLDIVWHDLPQITATVKRDSTGISF